MNSETDNDKALVDAWQTTQDLRTPEALNDAVLAEARKAAVASKDKKVRLWLRPMAFAATLLFGIFLVYDTQQPYETTVSPARQQELSDDMLPDAAPAAESDRDAPVAEAEERRKRLPSVIAPAAVMRATPADIEAARERKSEADQARTQFKASAEAAGDALDGFQDTANERVAGSRAPALRSELPEPAASAEFSAEPGCSNEQRQSAARWWTCVTGLRNAGDAEAADREMEGLLKAFPDFTVPE